MNLKLAILLFSTLLTLSCSKKFSENAPVPYLQLEKTDCMGPCPAFILTLKKNSTTLIGKANIDQLGTYASGTTADMADQLDTWLKSDDLIQSEAKYVSTKMLDLPTTYIRYDLGEGEKEILIYGDKPDHLKPIIEFLDGLRQELKWEKVSE